ncbi:siderophore ABC transporter substrate-binding protein [Peribacillus kribbensis]|uniref:siderophore ABC transporter substrate-binding protein n=1 Tax=Peribacillus kribbensis TaxID=356658 RepID=UPI0003FF40F3|nr:siderophore ABC transporter substrate-binding protein [Peribacillus kribbensis]
MRKISVFLLISMLVLFLAACGNSGKTTGSSSPKEDNTLTIKHQLGESKVPENPKKVVVFDFGALDSMDKLKLEDSVAGVPQKNVPVYLSKYKDSKYKNVGGLKEPDFEAINELKPDLIIISGRQQDSYDKFQEIAPTIFVGMDNKHYEKSFKDNANTIGKIFGKEKQVKEDLTAFDQTVKNIKDKASQSDEKALVTLTEGGKVTAFGPNSRFGLIHGLFGIKAAANDIEADPIHGQNISMEFIAEKNPDILYVIDRDAAIGEGENAKKVIENALVKKTNAYKNGKIIYLDPGYWYLSGGGLESSAKMAEEAAKGLE